MNNLSLNNIGETHATLSAAADAARDRVRSGADGDARVRADCSSGGSADTASCRPLFARPTPRTPSTSAPPYTYVLYSVCVVQRSTFPRTTALRNVKLSIDYLYEHSYMSGSSASSATPSKYPVALDDLLLASFGENLRAQMKLNTVHLQCGLAYYRLK